MVDDVFEVWQSVVADINRLQDSTLVDLFARDDKRAEKMTTFLGENESEIVVDYSKQIVDDQALQNLLSLAKHARVVEKFVEMRKGAQLNFTEKRPVLHTALREAKTSSVVLDGQDVINQVHGELEKLKLFSEKIRSEKKFKKIINIGIGGSDLGPGLVYEALKAGHLGEIECLFVSNLDSTEINAALMNCRPEETMFVVCSKSFKTAETLANTRIAKEWLSDGLGVAPESEILANHFAVVTANNKRDDISNVVGARVENIFKIWPWVGGRFSIASAMSLAPIIAFGFEIFADFLVGMRIVDDQMQNSEANSNAPLILGLLDVFNFGTGRYASQAILPYASGMRLLPNYLQQLMMESNGKSARQDDRAKQINTSPVVWGAVGTNSQHAFMQMLHQGTQIVPVDFIGFGQLAKVDLTSHDALIANMFAQARALAFGDAQFKKVDKKDHKNEVDQFADHRQMSGNRPSTTIFAKSLTPKTLGAMIAMYEHRVFVHGVIASINSFDQFGVELGKSLSIDINSQITQISSTSDPSTDYEIHDSSTQSLIAKYRHWRKK